MRAMGCTDHGINQSKVVFVLHTGRIVPRVPESGYYNALRGHNKDVLSHGAGGEESILREPVGHTPSGILVWTIVGPKSGTVLRTQDGATRPGDPAFWQDPVSVGSNSVIQVKLAEPGEGARWRVDKG
jgi:hypothetical protein